MFFSFLLFIRTYNTYRALRIFIVTNKSHRFLFFFFSYRYILHLQTRISKTKVNSIFIRLFYTKDMRTYFCYLVRGQLNFSGHKQCQCSEYSLNYGLERALNSVFVGLYFLLGQVLELRLLFRLRLPRPLINIHRFAFKRQLFPAYIISRFVDRVELLKGVHCCSPRALFSLDNVAHSPLEPHTRSYTYSFSFSPL